MKQKLPIVLTRAMDNAVLIVPNKCVPMSICVYYVDINEISKIYYES